MNREQYMQKRQELLGKAENCIKSGNLDEFKSFETQIKDLDTQFESEAKAQADLQALSNNAIGMQEDAINNIFDNNNTIVNNDIREIASSKTYEEAFTKQLMGKTMTPSEQKVFNQVNDVTVKNNSYLVPTTWVSQIWSEAEEIHPILGDVNKTSVPGDLDYPKAELNGNGAFYDEDDTITGDNVEGGDLHLKGYELAKVVTVSWKMQKMSLTDFQTWLRRKISIKLSNSMANAHFNGLGVAGSLDSHKSQPLGVITALKKEDSTPQVIEIEKDTEITYSSITYLISLVNSVYTKKSKFYANSKFIWRVLANIIDANGRPIFVPDPTGQTIGRMFGYVVCEEDAIADNQLVFGNFADAYPCNVQQDITLYTQDTVKSRKTDYMAYAIYDSMPLTTKAFALLEKKTS